MSMSVGRLAESGEIVAAQDIGDRPGLRLAKFLCGGCAIEVRPSAIGSVIVQPHFRRPPGVYHAGTCRTEDQVALRKQARTRAVLSVEDPPIPVFSRLLLPTAGAQSLAAPRLPAQANAAPAGTKAAPTKVERRNRTATRLEPIVEQFLNFPRDRGLPLLLPKASGTYRNMIVPVQQAWRQRFPGERIFYAPIGYLLVKEQSRTLTVPLGAGEYTGPKGEPHLPDTNRVHLKIDARAWHPDTLNSFRSQLLAAQAIEKKAGGAARPVRHDLLHGAARSRRPAALPRRPAPAGLRGGGGVGAANQARLRPPSLAGNGHGAEFRQGGVGAHMKLTISLLGAEDRDTAVDILAACFGEDMRMVAAADVAASFADYPYRPLSFMGKHEGETVAFVQAVPAYLHPRTYAVAWLAVLPQYRHRGYGAELLEAAETYVAANCFLGKAGSIILVSTRGRPYYERQGYSGDLKMHDGSPLMIKNFEGG